MYDSPIVELEGYYTETYYGFHLSHEASHNLHLSDLIGTDYLYDWSAWWSEPS